MNAPSGFDDEHTRRFAGLLHRVIGLDAHSIGTNAVMRAVRERLDVSGMATLDDYHRALLADPALMQELVEAVVVPETWFFRDPEVYAALARLARLRAHERPGSPVRVLSLPCSTGEEAYSVAMALIESGLAPERFVIEAIDVSERALSHARRAHYGRNAFRGRALSFRERHFLATDDGWQLDEAIAQCVRFTQANLFQLDARAFERFDFILCRNVLIYFDRETQSAALRVLDSLLAEGGTLFVGPAETGLLMREGMSPANIALAFAFRRPAREALQAAMVSFKAQTPREFVMPAWARAQPSVDHAAKHSLSTASEGLASFISRPVAIDNEAASLSRVMALTANASKPKPFAAFADAAVPASPVERVSASGSERASGVLSYPQASSAPAASAAGSPAPASTSADAPPQAVAGLTQAHALADAGRLIEAEAVARTWLHKHPASADAYYLLGVIADARNAHDESRAHYRRALYLDPTHREALTHLAALLQLDGDASAASIMLARAERSAENRR